MERKREVLLGVGSAVLVSLLAGSADAATVTFKKSKALDSEGNEKNVMLFLDDETVTVHEKGNPGNVLARFAYRDIKAMEYERAKSARLKTAIIVSPLVLFSKGKKHWLTIQYEGGAVILRLDKNEFRNVLGEMEARAPVELERVETK